MLQRLYIDNFRSFVNFELKPGSICLLVGGNGGGKSTLLDVITLLRDFIAGQTTVNGFTGATLTRWQSSHLQRFEMDVLIDRQVFSYRLVIEHDIQRGLRRVQTETLDVDSKPLYAFKDRIAQLYRDDYTQGPAIAFDWSRSGIGILQSGPSNQKLSQFRSHVSRILVLRLIPSQIAPESETEVTILDRSGQDYVSWYRAMSLEDPVAAMKIVNALRDIMPGLAALPLRESGNKRILRAQFNGVAGPPGLRYMEYDVSELSDGQRALLVLYSVLYFYEQQPFLLCLDEPDNYVALREIQPWIATLQDCCSTRQDSQAILVSHHPEVMNYLGVDSTHRLDREQAGATRIMPFVVVDGLTPAGTLARGWE